MKNQCLRYVKRHFLVGDLDNNFIEIKKIFATLQILDKLEIVSLSNIISYMSNRVSLAVFTILYKQF